MRAKRRWHRRRLVLAVASSLIALTGSSARDVEAVGAEQATPVGAVARGKIEVEGGLVHLSVEAEGIVTAVAVREGEMVAPGQVLLTLSPDMAATEVAIAQAEWRLAMARRKVAADRLPAAKDLARRLARAARKGAAEPLRAEQAARDLQDIAAASALAEAELALAGERLAQAKVRLDQTKLVAAQAGTVVEVDVQPGTYLSPQAGPAFILLPDRPLLVRAEVNEAFLPLVQVGDHATVSIDGNTGNDWSARASVVRISPIFQSTRLSDDGQSRPGVKVVDCYLQFDRPPDIRVGQGVKVSFDAK